MELVIISGRSGAGKSVALRALEDVGYYCVDNIPLPLVPELAAFFAKSDRSTVVSLDVRNLPENPQILDDVLSRLPKHIETKIIFLDCGRKTLIRRYSDSRRVHPLSNDNLSLESAIELENTLLDPLFHQANHIIDTTYLSAHELAEKLRELLRGKAEKEMQIVVESFGFKYGVPPDADYVFDVRFLPNPHWNPELRPMTGLEKPVIDFLERQTEVHNFIYHTRNYLEMWLPALEQNNRSYLTIAIGCTGGKHRSVFIAEQLAKYFTSRDKKVQVRHRSLEKHHKKA
ncbi:RNase adapter RapZ [Ursidibacter maritimus]|uniref:RNase adapter RapZ n=1 Tax=Ursidibacter maritimus TaxID=1331689 RepID=A0A949WMK5_9PAST|nr:RNase adapter RapZ [Ursidibacter maritimus]KAE9538982.1 RNase adaptor protein RapZ [Ursidibacter maritimus]MBV6524667.1 RNase adapter RapZ [Ursidibacter maritimus]MBV6525999.1 RNase adapter RapZ [Ursidibacter maritimus]MBV6527914.1 RNase adapter RapZ [Ursidibacter maritimus]MBV6528853.1 RNase adapter RapZ [Ursidibacter maritimus]